MSLKSFPLLLSAEGSSILPANLWLAERAQEALEDELNVATIQRDAWSLVSYFSYIEELGMEWNASGPLKADRPTYKFRSHLKKQRTKGDIAPTTAAQQISAVARFYNWALQRGLLKTSRALFVQADRVVRVYTEHGNSVSKIVFSTDLHLSRKRKNPRPRPPGGLLPVSAPNRAKILTLAQESSSLEFFLMLSLGFFTGMRIQSISDLKLKTLRNAQESETPRFKYLLIGPQHNVATKFSANGKVIIPTSLLDQLEHYSCSVRRLNRIAKAEATHRELLFVNRNGRPYGREGRDASPSVNVDMHRLREVAKERGLDLRLFYFHCTRATFATSIVQAGMKTEGVSVDAIVSRLTDLLCQREERTALGYVRFVEKSKLLAKLEDEYSSWLFGEA
jgi:integrase